MSMTNDERPTTKTALRNLMREWRKQLSLRSIT